VLEWVKGSGEVVWNAALLSSLLGAAAVDKAVEACKVSSAPLTHLACAYNKLSLVSTSCMLYELYYLFMVAIAG
jgi:hypothetical protein